ncbi:ATP-dependent RNA helicase DDX31/DBP7 [Clonorchis sinensis]|uniref:ATP-dependent RNA helicase n=1 Tax=Clonorchis sinensis TaxID=79923 RepID=G7Y533_CLOSI|nr:ATP-dependent RNA helicase DDX31/DBP7 [Clonorchis sinensis]
MKSSSERSGKTTVEPRIEPVFSEELWKPFCDSLGVHSFITSCLVDRFKLTRLTAIQKEAIPHLLEGKDCLIRAQTGSGKTLAYAVPLFHQLMSLEPPISRTHGTLALIILPTRELATQTFEVFQLLGKACVRIVPGCLIGGMKRKSQKVSLSKGLNILIGTPQRILDHILRSVNLSLSKLLYLVIDEADRLLEMGFEQSVRRIIDHIREVSNAVGKAQSLQTVLLSATLTPGVEKLAGLTLRQPVRCVVRETDAHSSGPSSPRVNGTCEAAGEFVMPTGLKHYILVVPWKLRLSALAAFLLLKCRYHKGGGKLIIFMATQDSVDFHYQLFKTVLVSDDEEFAIPIEVANLSLFRLHGKMEHNLITKAIPATTFQERESVFHSFCTSKSGILLTTDVASRGLDLAGVAWVVQYQVTGGPVDYVHRVGRTARAGGRGKALLFLDNMELGFADLLRARAGIVFEELSLADLMQTALFHVRHMKRNGLQLNSCTTVEEGVSRFFGLFLDAVCEDPVLHPLAEVAYTSFLRSYASFSGELRTFFTFKRLHLGHVARAFCLQATPRDIAARVSGRFSSKFEKSKKEKNVKINEIGDRKQSAPTDKKRAFELAFDPKPSSRNTKRAKPTDIAKRNMLAEFGL